MAASRPEPRHDYRPLPSNHDQTTVVLAHYHPPSPHRRIILTIFAVSLLSTLLYLFWPSDPNFEIVRLKITSVHVRRRPVVSIDMTMRVTLKVSNVDVYSLDYETLDVAIGYRGKVLGHVTSEKGHVRAMGSSYVDAETEFNGVGVWTDVVHLIQDLAKGCITFDTVTAVNGQLGILVFRFPLKVRLSCEILINTINETIARQNCYPT